MQCRSRGCNQARRFLILNSSRWAGLVSSGQQDLPLRLSRRKESLQPSNFHQKRLGKFHLALGRQSATLQMKSICLSRQGKLAALVIWVSARLFAGLLRIRLIIRMVAVKAVSSAERADQKTDGVKGRVALKLGAGKNIQIYIFLNAVRRGNE